MYCGSCMHDNALALELRSQGVDCVLQPVYTPIRTDAPSVAGQQVFFGGIHIYVLQQWPWLRHVPLTLRRVLDWTPLIRMATSRSHSTDAAKLGQLTISMLKGTEGRQSEEVMRLVNWLAGEMRPDAILLSNLLIGGVIPEVRRRLPRARLVVLLQGDDIFLEHLPPKEHDEAVALLRGLVPHVDKFVLHTRFYADKMGALLDIPPEKIVVTPLSIDLSPFDRQHQSSEDRDQFRIGYLARIAPEKGLHHLVDAFLQLASEDRHEDAVLHVAGWLGESNREYLETEKRKIDRAGLSDRFIYHGSPDLDAKIAFLQSLDLLCVPTDYEEPKGLFVLEALAAGVPVVQPQHGAFPELVEATGGGLLVRPRDVEALSKAIARLKDDRDLLSDLAKVGNHSVRTHHSIERAAREMQEILFADAAPCP